MAPTAETSSEDAKDEAKPAAADASDAPSSEDKPEAPAAELAEPKAAEPEKERVLPRGNALRWKRGGITALIGGLGAFLLMAHNGQLRFGVPFGFLFMLAATWGVLDLCGSFDDDVEPAAKLDTSQVLRALAGVGGAGLVFCASLMGGQSGALKQWIWGVLVTLTFELLVYAIFNFGVKLGPWAKDEAGVARPDLGTSRLLAGHDRRAALLARARELLALGSVGDALRRGRARDPRARRLGFALVGARRVVLVEADPELLDPSARDGVARHALPAGSNAHRRGRARERAPRVGRACAELPSDRDRRCTSSTRASRRSSVVARVSSAGSCSRRCPIGSSSRTRR